MATYFIDPYKKYNSKLGEIGNASSVISSTTNKISEAYTEINRLKTAISNSNWSEQGVEQLNDNVFPLLSNSISTFMNNISSNMSKIVSAATNLYEETEALKNEDENYEKYREQLNNLGYCSKYDEKGSPNPEYYGYVMQKNELESKLNNSKIKCESYVRNCDSLVNTIRGLDGSLTDFKVSLATFANGRDNTVAILKSVNNGKMLKIKFNGKEFYVANSKINCLDYAKYIQEYKLYQDAGVCPSDCMLLSQYYAMDMMRGSFTDGNAMVSGAGSPATRINDYVKSHSKDDILRYLYNETLAGRPTVLQVSQVNSHNGDRHLVTVVGFDTSVKSYKDLNPDNIFVLDCYDGKLQTLSLARSKGGHERRLFASGGYYLVRGATDAFKNEEVYNA